jgi:hypothetical protein
MDTIKQEEAQEVVGKLTRWYFMRMLRLFGLFLLIGLYFIYDGKIGYPKANLIADKKDWFETVHLAAYEKAIQENRFESWQKENQMLALPSGTIEAPPSWAKYAAGLNLPEKPHRYTDKEIQEQFYWGAAMLLFSLIPLGMWWGKRKKEIKILENYWVTPDQQKIMYSEVTQLDMRPWLDKGFARVEYQLEGTEKKGKTIIDDLMYTEGEVLLERLKKQLKGELIEEKEELEVNENRAD